MNSAHPGCAENQTLRNLAYVFAYCAGRYVECPVYRRLLADAREDEQPTGRQRRLAS
jgi:hypothetical protein